MHRFIGKKSSCLVVKRLVKAVMPYALTLIPSEFSNEFSAAILSFGSESLDVSKNCDNCSFSF